MGLLQVIEIKNQLYKLTIKFEDAIERAKESNVKESRIQQASVLAKAISTISLMQDMTEYQETKIRELKEEILSLKQLKEENKKLKEQLKF
tara:strand:- start:3192 stop:3464 length:273 start_codon:yes stop_codon:yes gene_type:complete